MTLTDEEIRVKIAELMGWSCLGSMDDHDALWKSPLQVKGLMEGPWFRFDHIPNYLNDPAAALQLCDRMHSEGFECVMTFTLDGEWNVDFLKQGYKGEMISDPSLARAICLCFLAAYEND